MLNRRTQKGGHYVGRHSALGNPFQIGVAGGRTEVIKKYRVWLAERILQDSPQRQELERLVRQLNEGKELALACWCAPAPCHADVVKEVLVARVKGKEWGAITRLLQKGS